MNSKIVTTLTATITCLSIVSAGAVIYYDRASNEGRITVDSREEFLTVNQDLMPTTASSIMQNSGQSLIGSLFTGKEIPDTDTDVSIWASSDNPEFQTMLEDTSFDLKIHYDKANSEAMVNAFLTENGTQTLSLYANVAGDTAGLYSPYISENYYDLTKEQFIYGFESTSGISLEAINSGSDDMDTDNSEIKDSDMNNSDKETSDKETSDKETSNKETSDNNTSDETVTNIEDSEFMNILNVILTAVTKDNVTASYSDNIYLEHVGETISGTTYTCQPSADDFENMLYDLSDYMDTHESARTYIHNILGNISERSSSVKDIENLLVNKDGCLKDRAKSLASTLSSSGFSWSVISDNTGMGRYLNLTFVCNGINIMITSEKTPQGVMYMSASLDDSYISILNTPSAANDQTTSFLGLSYGTIELTTGDMTSSTKAVITTTRSEDNTQDETVISFYAGSRMGNIELHIQSTNSSTASMPLIPADNHTDLTTSTNEEVLQLFKTYHNTLTSILLSSKILGTVM